MAIDINIPIENAVTDGSLNPVTSNAVFDGLATKANTSQLAGLVPYTGAVADVDLGTHKLTATDLVVNHPSGSGDAATITKGGNGEALKVVKSSGSGNAASITGGVTLLTELDLQTPLADAEIASAATWNAKIGGAVSIGQVAFGTASGVIGGDAGLFWDNTNKRLDVAETIKIYRGSKNAYIGLNSDAILGDFPGIWFNTSDNNRTVTNYSFLKDSLNTIVNTNAGGGIFFRISNTNSLIIDSLRNVAIGSAAPQARLDVRAQGALSTDIAFRVRNSADTRDIINIKGDQTTRIGSTAGDQANINITTSQIQINKGEGLFVRFLTINRSIVVNNGSANTGIVDAFEQYSADIVAGNAAPHFRTENGSVIKLYKEAAVTTPQGIANALANIGLIEASTITPSIPTHDGATYDTNAIQTVTAAEYAALTPNASTLYFIV